MYKAGMKLIELCNMIDSLKDIEEEAKNKQKAQMDAGIDEDDGVMAAGLQNEIIFKVGDFNKALLESSEVSIYDTLVTSNQQKLA